jgi:hypothetical protein
MQVEAHSQTQVLKQKTKYWAKFSNLHSCLNKYKIIS